MAAFAGGKLRFTKKAAGGERLNWTPWIDYTLLDNTSSPIVFINDTDKGATINDRKYAFPFVINGPDREMFDVEFLHTAAMTPATASHVCNIDIKRAYVRAGKKIVTPDQLT